MAGVEERVQRTIDDLSGMDQELVLEVSGRVSVKAALFFMRLIQQQKWTEETRELKNLFILERDDESRAR